MARHIINPGGGPIRSGRVIGWDGVNPLVAWESGIGDVREVGPPDHGEMWWLGDSPSNASAIPEDFKRTFCRQGHGRMVQDPDDRQRYRCNSCTYTAVTAGVL